MVDQSSAIAPAADLVSKPPYAGLTWGLVGVGAFSLTLPLTRYAVGGLEPLFIGAGRAVVAAVLATAALTVTRQRFPSARQWARLLVVGAGIVIVFPLLTTYALTSSSASHGAVMIALLPAATAVLAVLRGHEHPPPAFWVAAGLGAVAALSFAFVQTGGFGSPDAADLLLLVAVLGAAVGYAEGGLLARELGAWQTVSWALVLCAPLMTALTVLSASRQTPEASPLEWGSFAYLGAVSMFLGFVAWYCGLAIGPMAQVSQVQLVQPVMTMAWAGLLLGEHLSAATVLGGLTVITCAGSAVRVRSNRPT